MLVTNGYIYGCSLQLYSIPKFSIQIQLSFAKLTTNATRKMYQSIDSTGFSISIFIEAKHGSSAMAKANF